MTIVLHRFPLSHYSEKARATLEFKGLDYTIVEHVPGPEQMAIYKLSGQRKVPVIVHDGDVIHDSTTIALHLDRAFPGGDDRRALLPDDIRQRRAVLDLEDRIDASIGRHAVLLAVAEAVHDRELFDEYARASLDLGGVGVLLSRSLGMMSRVALALPKARAQIAEAREAVSAMVVELSARLERGSYLMGEEPTLADVAAAGLCFLLKFPDCRGVIRKELVGRGATRFTEDPKHRRFFAWRERFYREVLR